MRTQELWDVLEEEASILEDDKEDENLSLVPFLRSAMKKLRGSPPYEFSDGEKVAIQFALDDVGDLYIQTGTCGGFNRNFFESNAEMVAARERGIKAFNQARRMGVV